MALHGNYSVFNKSPGRWLGGNSTSHASGVGSAQAKTPTNWNNNGSRRNIAVQEYSTDVLELLAIPAGYGGVGWMMPIGAGALSSHNAANGAATASASVAAGRNLSGAAAGVATASATGQLVVSGSGSAAGSATLSGNVTAALAASGTASGSATATGTLTAKGNISGASAGAATVTATRYAIGHLSGSIAPAITLEAAGFSSYLLDEEDIETGLTLRQALRLIAAATAGKVSGGGTTTITIRNAVADSDNRIVATVDSNGNRTAITYDLN